MFQALRKHISPATVVAFMALVFAMTGGAFAATGSGGGGNTGAKASASVTPAATAAKAKAKAKTKAGARGPAGPKGATGAVGAAGAQGAKGETGAAGAAGAKGETGAAGGQGPQGPEGPQGPQGDVGAKGNPAEFPKTLPEGRSLSGYFAGTGWGEEGFPHAGVGQALAAVTYAIPLGEEFLGSNGIHLIDSEEVEAFEEGNASYHLPTGCTATFNGSNVVPGAEPGNLCVFAETEVNVATAQRAVFLHGESGFVVNGVTNGKGRIALAGVWAVTAP